jgi:ATP-binding cassette subfamily F protein 3
LINALASRVVEVEHGHLENHLGNYDAYLERKARTLLNPSTPTSENGATARPPASAPTTPMSAPLGHKLSHKEGRIRDREQRKTRQKIARRIEKLEAQIAEHEQRKEALNWKLGDPAVYQDAERTRALQAEQTELGDSIETLYRDWERLSEELAGLTDDDATAAAADED